MTQLKTVHVKGLPPISTPLAGKAIEDRLRDESERKSKEHADQRSDDPARFVASDAYACARKVAFSRLRVPKDIEYDAAQLMTFRVGDWYHQVTQEALVQWLDCRCEVDFDLRPAASVYGRCDGVYERDGIRCAVEIKSQAGFGFDLSTGGRKSDQGPGPKADHLIQVGMAAVSPQIDAQAVHVIYINKDRGVVAEWIIGLDEPLPHLGGVTIRSMVAAELERFKAIGDDLDDGYLPARIVPDHGLVIDPPAAGSRANPWNCRYCSWQPSCALLAAERIRFVQTEDRRVLEVGEEAS